MLKRLYPDGVAGAFSAGGVGIALAVALGISGSQTATVHAPEPAVVAPYSAVIAGAPLQCDSETRDATRDEAPSSAVIETPSGRTRVVPFSRGWDVYTGRAAGTLLAVCTPSGPAAFGPVS